MFQTMHCKSDFGAYCRGYRTGIERQDRNCDTENLATGQRLRQAFTLLAEHENQRERYIGDHRKLSDPDPAYFEASGDIGRRRGEERGALPCGE